jgi:hypothetical protein
MAKRRSEQSSVPPGAVRRGPHRARILAALHGICLRLERLQRSEDAREACREVAGLLAEARRREERGSSSGKP